MKVAPFNIRFASFMILRGWEYLLLLILLLTPSSWTNVLEILGTLAIMEIYDSVEDNCTS